MNIKKNTLLLTAATLLLSSSHISLAKDNTNRLSKMYKQAVKDTSLIESGEESVQLTAITSENEDLIWNEDKTKILVVTWKSEYAYSNFIEPYTSTADNEKFVTWVTVVPEVKEFCEDFIDRKKRRNLNDKLDLRLKKLLGLNHTWNYDVFVELWVSPDDLFRPCTDPEITDTSCNVNFNEDIPAVKNIEDYQRFYQNLYFSSFRSEGNTVPWSGLGYTYDWAQNNTDVGLSEFIIVPSGEYEINKVQYTAEYCGLDVPDLGESY